MPQRRFLNAFGGRQKFFCWGGGQQNWGGFMARKQLEKVPYQND
jgi:hypothetical protein